jgi:hypothetical protein
LVETPDQEPRPLRKWPRAVIGLGSTLFDAPQCCSPDRWIFVVAGPIRKLLPQFVMARPLLS